MEFLYEYGLFLAKAITFIIAIAIIVGIIVGAGQRSKKGAGGNIEVTFLNDHYKETQQALKEAILDEAVFKQEEKEAKKQQKADKKKKKKQAVSSTDETTEVQPRVFLIDFDGDIKASAVENLREEITAILGMATKDDEVMVRLESAGGMVHSYGLASSQLSRLKDRNIPLTICVDKVAASGGYMMACVATTIYAAPFAIIGSIGVVAQLPNFHRLLKKNDVDFELLTAGEYKRTLTMFGENTDKGRQKFVEDLDNTHELFKKFVHQQRPIVDIDGVATGEIWFGSEAKEKQLIDGLMTSDDYLLKKAEEASIYHIEHHIKKSLPERLGLGVQATLESAFTVLLDKLQGMRFIK